MECVVIGGGIAGLAAAWELVRGGARVTVLEAAGRVGGKLHAGEIEGLPVDLGAESMLARRPEAVELARAVGLGDALRPVATAGAAVWSGRSLRPLPKGQVMGVPASAAALAASSGLVTAEALERVAREDSLAPADVGEDVAVGEYVAARMGREVVDRLVEPLLGGVYAGDAYRISMRAAVPALYAALREGRTLTGAVRAVQQAAPAASGPVFLGIEGGVGRLPGAVAAEVAAGGGTVLTGCAATGLRRVDGRWRVSAGERDFDADAVVVALPAPAAARLLRTAAPASAGALDAVAYASMALVTVALRRAEAEAALPAGSGFLVPPVEGRVIKAATFSSRKWAWTGDRELFLLRASVGRHGDTADLERDDEELVGLALRDLRLATGLAAKPVASLVSRWAGGLPQYEVGHTALVERVRGALPAGLALCGALYEGVGIPACVAGGRRAAAGLLRGARDPGAAGGPGIMGA
ncbi:protoporphyrinogen oxidase [Streptomyces polyrhachis]|uniref:Coproporphyrinogen III oxidase n=1 Tax=Streptomyces polyrhachis TaxID=1282885 RepID=A0ABW2GC76_9ACTN